MRNNCKDRKLFSSECRHNWRLNFTYLLCLVIGHAVDPDGVDPGAGVVLPVEDGDAHHVGHQHRLLVQPGSQRQGRLRVPEYMNNTGGSMEGTSITSSYSRVASVRADLGSLNT
jgi:hypothetical protein